MPRILLVLALLLGLAACGDDDDAAEPVTGVESSDTVEDTDPDVEDEVDLDDPAGADDDLINAIEGYARTVIEGDPEEIAGRHSAGCADVETQLEIDGNTTDSGDISVRDVEAEIDGDEATVSYGLDPVDQQVSEERWVREDGEWKWDNC